MGTGGVWAWRWWLTSI